MAPGAIFRKLSAAGQPIPCSSVRRIPSPRGTMARHVDPVRKSVKETLDDLLAGHSAARHAGPASALNYLERVLAGQASLPMAVRSVVYDRMADAQAQLHQWPACVESVNLAIR